jgi:hypothetical protein
MTIDTKGFLTTTEKNPFKIWRVIKACLIEDMMATSGAKRQFELWWNDESGYTCPTARIHDFAEYIDIHFQYKTEDRMLGVFLDCDSDYEYVLYPDSPKIILNLGCWGSSVHLIDTVLHALQAEFGGRMFIIENDCSDEWKELK